MTNAIVFDIDNTLTSPRKPIEKEMADTLKSCRVPFSLAAGSDLPLGQRQLLEPLYRFGYRGVVDAFLCNGASHYRCAFHDELSIKLIRDFSLRNHLGDVVADHLMQEIAGLLGLEQFKLPHPIRIEGDQIIDRGSMINVAPIGRPKGDLTQSMFANRDLFREFDRREGYRRRFMDELRARIRNISGAQDLVVSLGGETSFDIVARGNDKSYAIRTLLDEGFEKIVYIGDALFPGGNDEAILDFIAGWPNTQPCPVEAIRVNNWRETCRRLRKLGVVRT